MSSECEGRQTLIWQTRRRLIDLVVLRDQVAIEHVVVERVKFDLSAAIIAAQRLLDHGKESPQDLRLQHFFATLAKADRGSYSPAFSGRHYRGHGPWRRTFPRAPAQTPCWLLSIILRWFTPITMPIRRLARSLLFEEVPHTVWMVTEIFRRCAHQAEKQAKISRAHESRYWLPRSVAASGFPHIVQASRNTSRNHPSAS
jgi:hypothetical protein